MMIYGGKCSRCGAEESMFWYPYAFGMAPIPSVVDCNIDHAQYFNLCDKCQQEFIEFMRNEKWPNLDPEKLKKMIGDIEPIPTPIIEHEVNLEKVNESKLDFSDRKEAKE